MAGDDRAVKAYVKWATDEAQRHALPYACAEGFQRIVLHRDEDQPPEAAAGCAYAGVINMAAFKLRKALRAKARKTRADYSGGRPNCNVASPLI